jgi:hypothetical protein
MVSSTAKEVFIQGITLDGKTFRPSDWAERLAGVMSSFRPGGAQPGSHLSYSPWCIPTVINGVKCVVVNRDLRDVEPMAWDFCHQLCRGTTTCRWGKLACARGSRRRTPSQIRSNSRGEPTLRLRLPPGP